jgi:hypothetical protein
VQELALSSNIGLMQADDSPIVVEVIDSTRIYLLSRLVQAKQALIEKGSSLVPLCLNLRVCWSQPALIQRTQFGAITVVNSFT